MLTEQAICTTCITRDIFHLDACCKLILPFFVNETLDVFLYFSMRLSSVLHLIEIQTSRAQYKYSFSFVVPPMMKRAIQSHFSIFLKTSVMLQYQQKLCSSDKCSLIHRKVIMTVFSPLNGH